eukprot:COSAG06_NODE_8389_length_2188_cov_18.419818_2_plen_153_part_00
MAHKDRFGSPAHPRALRRFDAGRELRQVPPPRPPLLPRLQKTPPFYCFRMFDPSLSWSNDHPSRIESRIEQLKTAQNGALFLHLEAVHEASELSPVPYQRPEQPPEQHRLLPPPHHHEPTCAHLRVKRFSVLQSGRPLFLSAAPLFVQSLSG